MEITWDLKLEQKAAERVKDIAVASSEKTPFEKLMDKKKEKRKAKKNRKEVQNDEDDNVPDNEDDQPFSEDDVDVDMDDPYFKQGNEKTSNKKKIGKKVEVQPTEEELRKVTFIIKNWNRVHIGQWHHCAKYQSCIKLFQASKVFQGSVPEYLEI